MDVSSHAALHDLWKDWVEPLSWGLGPTRQANSPHLECRGLGTTRMTSKTELNCSDMFFKGKNICILEVI